MKKQIRNNVFETNSSSVHSLVINSSGMESSNLIVNPKTNKVSVTLDYFGGSTNIYSTQLEKLTYLVTFIAVDMRGSLDKIKDEFTFKELNKIIIDKANCDGIEITNLYSDPWFENWGFDHQTSPANGNSCIINIYDKTEMENFIFNSYIVLKTEMD